MSNFKSKPAEPTLPTVPAGLEGAATELAAASAEQSTALDAETQRQALATARAYELLQADRAAGKPILGWSDYLAKASE